VTSEISASEIFDGLAELPSEAEKVDQNPKVPNDFMQSVILSIVSHMLQA
jgi:hypothetical protein